MRSVIIGIVGLAIMGSATAAYFMSGPTTVDLGQIVIGVHHTEIIEPTNAKNPNLIDVKSGNPSVATAVAYRVGQVQIVGVAPGKTEVEFFDATNRVLYKKLVWVERNAPGGGGGSSGYDSTRTQLEQVVMLPRHTQNVVLPGGGQHQLSSVTSSNTGVATARTEPPNAIQIYSIALGDTWINFADNGTNTLYQVHVWVVSDLSFVPPPLPGPEPNPAGPNSPDSNSNSAGPDSNGPDPESGEMDECLIGTWKVIELADLNEGWTGGAGAIATFGSDGTQTIDYGSMSNFVKANDSMTWTGTTVSTIASANGAAKLIEMKSGNLLMTL